MKKIISLVLAFMMSLNICMIANAESILTGSYTFIDSAYSPKLDMYVVMAKDFNSGNHETELYSSKDGVNWTKVLKESNGKNYANQKVRQNLVWWEKEQVFVAQIAGTKIGSFRWDGSRASGKVAAKALKGNNAVLIAGAGALCAGTKRSDLDAVELIMARECQTIIGSVFFGAGDTLSPIDAKIMRVIYQTKYSKKAE